MASSRSADVNLIIRARNEADRAIESVATALQGLYGDAEHADTGVAELGKTLAALDKAAASVIGSVDKAGSALDRQTANITENRAALAALVAQQSEARQILAGFGDQANKAFVGPRTEGFTKTYAAVRAEADRLEAAIKRTSGTIAQQESAVAGAQSSLLKLSLTSGAIAEAQTVAEARIGLTTQALNEQASAAGRVTEVQRRINALTGVDRPNRSGSAAAVADILAAADAEFRLAEARAAQIQKLREEEAATAQLADAQRRNQQFSQSQGVTADPRGSQARASAAVFEADARDAETAQALRDKLDPLAATHRKLNDELARYRQLAAAGKLSANELAAAEKHVAEEAERASAALGGAGVKPALFGLKPYELQNLGYQVNDVATQLASGTSLTQTLGQQGGQILQLFPRVTSAIIAAFTNPAFLGAAAVFAAIALGVKRAADESERLRKINATLNFRADGGSYDAKALADQERQLERNGVAAKDAEAAIKSFLDHSVAPERIAEFSRAARATAEVLGTELPDAANQVAEAFTGGYTAIAKFDDKLNFLTASQREHIRTLFEEGRAGEARTEALQIYTAKQDEAAQKSRGNWAGATRELGGAVSDLLDLLAKTSVVEGFARSLTNLAGAARAAIGDIRNVGDLSGTLQEIADKRAYIARLDAKIAASPNAPDIGASRASRDDAQRGLATLVARYNDLAKAAGAAQVAADGTLKATAKTGDTVTGGADTVVAKDRADRLATLDLEKQLEALRDRGQAGLNAADSRRRETLAGELAYRNEIAATGDAVIAGRLRENAVAHETAAVDKQNDAARKSALADRERQISQFEQRVVGAEGGAGKNPHGSAQGYGQFVDKTFLSVYSRTPGADQSLSRDQILALRQNEKVARGVLDQYARENAKFLEGFGAKVTAGNLYLAHFLGAGGAKAVLTANGATPVDQIIQRLPNAGKVLSGNQGYLRTENGKGRYRTAAELQTFLAGRVGGDTGSPQTGLVEEQARIAQANVENQNKLNLAIQHGNEDRARAIDGLTKEAGLYGTALLAEQKRQAVAQAELDLRQRVEDQNRNLKPGESPVVVTAEQVQNVKDLAAGLFDVAHAREALLARQNDAQRPVDDLEAQRDLLRQQAEFLRSIGDNSSADKVDKQIVGLTGSIEAAYDALIKFYEALSPDERVQLGIVSAEQFDHVVEKLKLAKAGAQDMGRTFGILNTQIRDTFSGALASSLTSFITKVASGKNVFKSLGQSVREFAATFIASIAQILVQMAAYAATVSVLRALGVPIPTFAFGSHHTGGTVGQGGAKRIGDPGWFAGAMRFHTGGVVGLKPNERAIIAEDGEEVLTSRDPRHRANGGLGGGGGRSPSYKIVNLFDKDEAAQQLITTKAGEKAILNLVRTNPRAFKAALDG